MPKIINKTMLKTGKCIQCNKRTQGKDNAEFLCKSCSTIKYEIEIKQIMNQITEFDFGWLCGIIEGEGCFYKKETKSALLNGQYCYPLCGFCLMSTDHDVMFKISNLLKINLLGPYYSNKDRKSVWSVQTTGQQALLIMQHFKSHMSQRRQVQIDEAIAWQLKGKFKVDNV